ncbi:MAG: 50S ribosomal protein L17 [Bacteroidales bacterium]|jgi:large subunit ribosomal protein L17|nr:50S ribosomal protein L17 [Bacteroidales bacterium]
MRHGCKVNKLSRTHAHRAAMLSNMASSLILHKRIETTLAKAKALRIYVEPLITKSKIDNTHQRRVVFSYLRDKEAVTELFREISTKIANRNGGYTRILKLGRRLGDGAEMAMMELVDYNENMLKDTTAKKAKTTRRAGSKSAAGQQKKESPVAEVKAEEKVENAPEPIEEATPTAEATVQNEVQDEKA